MDLLNRYPKGVEGDLSKDNFFDANPEISVYGEMKKLIEKEGRDKASKVMWCYYILKDPRSFYVDKMTYEERKVFCVREFYGDMNFVEFKPIEEFYEDKIVMNEDILDYQKLKQKYEKNIASDAKYSITQAASDKEALLLVKQKAYSVLNKGEQLRIQGKKQPGLIAGYKLEDDKE